MHKHPVKKRLAISRSPNFADAHAAKFEAEVVVRRLRPTSDWMGTNGMADLDEDLKQTAALKALLSRINRGGAEASEKI